jgi:hypothetical protein
MLQYLELYVIMQLVHFPGAPFWTTGTFFDATLVLPQLIFTFQNFRLQCVNYFCQQKMSSRPTFNIQLDSHIYICDKL